MLFYSHKLHIWWGGGFTLNIKWWSERGSSDVMTVYLGWLNISLWRYHKNKEKHTPYT